MIAILKKFVFNIKDYFVVAFFCLKLALQASSFYFCGCMLLNLLAILLQLLLIRAYSQMISVMVGGLGFYDDLLYRGLFLKVCLIYLAINIVNRIVDGVKTYCDGMHREVMQSHIKLIMMEKFSDLDISFFDSSDFYNEVSDTGRTSPLIIQSAFHVIDLVRYFIQLILVTLYFLLFNPVFVLLLYLAIIPQVISRKKQLNAVYSFQREHLENERKMSYSSGLVYSKDYIKDIKLFNLFPYMRDKYVTAWKALFSKKKGITVRYTRLVIIVSILPEIVVFYFYLSMGYRVFSGSLDMGRFTYYQGIMSQVIATLYMVISSFGLLADGKMRIKNFIRLMKWENKLDYSGLIEFSGSYMHVEFINVSFRYDDSLPYVLKNISFSISTPEKIAFVGINGSGKSTIIKLLMRFYDPTEGAIILNNVNLKEYTIESIRKCFSPMFQDYCKYAFSIKEAISISNVTEMENMEKIRDAIHNSGSYTFVNTLPKKEDTFLTRQYEMDGVELSGGQWQKIAMARTFFRKAQIYIFDEPSASLDAESEEELFKRFEAIYQNESVILISHRLSNISKVDKIIVIENSTIIEQGHHSDLIKKDGRYAQLYKLQAQKYEMI